MAFHVGQKVVCINAEGARCLQWETVYTVTAIDDEFLDVDACNHCNHGSPCNWFKSRFRPLTDRKSEVSFTTGADPESERYDNRRKQKERV